MGSIDIRRFGLAWGATFALLYLGCVFVMWSAGKEATILFFNSLLHGLDVRPIIRMDVSWWEVLMGIVEIFIIGWLTGAVIAAIYNLGASRDQKP
jgi:hypothetical protein